MKEYIFDHVDQVENVHVKMEPTTLDGVDCMRIHKCEKVDIPDENTYGKIKNLDFHNGTIIARLRSRLLPDAPAIARGFIGITFRCNTSDSEFESFYVRPTNGRNCDDPMRRSHGCQYFSYPGYTFSYFREFGITDYEAPIDIDLDEWFELKAVIEDDHGSFYINDQLLLEVDHFKHGPSARGSVGIYVDMGTEGFVEWIKVIPND